MLEQLARDFYNRGLEQAGENRIGEAVKNLTRAVSYDGGLIEAWNLAGLCCYRLGKFKTAEFCWAHSVQEQPLENKAASYLMDLRDSLAETAPSFSKIASLCEHNRYGEAATILEKEINSRFDGTAALLNLLGVLHLLRGKTGAAIESWETVLTIDHHNTTAKRYLAEVQRRGRPGQRLGRFITGLFAKQKGAKRH